MLWTKVLMSPMPHARVKSIDTSAAEAMPGVKAILTQDDLPAVVEGANLGGGTRWARRYSTARRSAST